MNAPSVARSKATHRTGRRLVVGIPDGPCPQGLLLWVADTARSQECSVVLVHGWLGTSVDVPETGFSPGIDVELRDSSVAQLAEDAAAVLRQHGVSATVVTSGEEGADVIFSVLQPGDLVVVGASTGDFVSRLHGSVVHRLIEKAPGPVIVVPGDWRPSAAGVSAPIVLGYDGTRRSEGPLRWAIDQCSKRGVALILAQARVSSLFFAPDDEGNAKTLDHIRKLAADEGVFDVSGVDAGDANHGLARRLEALADGAGLLVLGNHRASWLAEVTGVSITEHASLHASCPVAVVPSSPVV